MTYFLRLLLVFLLVIPGCKKPPTFSTDNVLDPNHPDFELLAPENLRIVTNETEKGLLLLWNQGRDVYPAMNGYQIYKSFSPNTEPEFLTTIPVIEHLTRFAYHDTARLSFYQKYEVRSYFERKKDTLYSPFSTVVYSNIPENSLNIFVNPYLRTPEIRIQFNTWPSNTFEVDLYQSLHSDTSLITSFPVNGEQFKSTFPVEAVTQDVQYLYKIRKGSSESHFFEAPHDIYSPSISIGNPTYSNKVLSFNFSPTPGDTSTPVPDKEPYFDRLEVLIESLNQSGQVVSSEKVTIDQPNLSDYIEIVNPDSQLTYRLITTVFNGEFSDTVSPTTFNYLPTLTHSKTTPTFRNNVDHVVFDWNESEDKLLVASWSTTPVIYNLETGARNGVPTNSQIQQVKFFYPFDRPGEHVLTSSSTWLNRGVNLWEVKADQTVQSVTTYPNHDPDNFNVFSFAVKSEKELIFLTEHRNLPITVLTLYDLETDTHSELYRISQSSSPGSHAIYNAQKNYVHFVIREWLTDHEKISLFTYDLNISAIIAETEIPITTDDIKLDISNDGNNILVSGNRRYMKYNADNLNVIQSYSWSSSEITDVRNVQGSNLGTEVCKGLRVNVDTSVECTLDLQESKTYFNYSSQKELFGMQFNTIDKIVLLYENEIQVLEFDLNWVISSD